MFNILQIIWQSLLIQYIIIIECKNLLSYNEEIYLYTVYISLFVLIWISSLNSIRNSIIKDSFNLIEFYEILYYVKLLQIYVIKKYNNYYKKKQTYKYLLKIIYYFYYLKNFIWKKEELNIKLQLIKELQSLNIKELEKLLKK